MRKALILIFVLSLTIMCFVGVACGGMTEQRVPDDSDIGQGGNVSSMSLFSNLKSIESIDEDFTDNDVFFMKNKKGILINALSNSANAIYNYAIDLKEVEGSVIEFEILKNDAYEMSSVDITLIDIYDKDNYISVNFSENVKNSNWGTVTAKGATAPTYLGFDNFTTGIVNNSGFSFYANNFDGIDNKNVVHHPFNFSFDVETNVVSVDINAYDSCEVLNLEDSKLFNESTSFKGFRTGEVYLKIEFKNVVKLGGLVITKIGNKNYDSLVDKTLPNENLIFEEPVLSSQLYSGSVGYNYNLPVPVSSDMLFGERVVSSTLKNLDNNSEVAFSDYSFRPDVAGDYLITYSYKDNFGNTVEIPFEFEIKAQPEQITFDFEEKNYLLGSKDVLPEVDVTGGNGGITIEKAYFYNEQALETDDAEIMLDKTGYIKLKVTAIDQIGYKEEDERIYEIEKRAIMEVDGLLPFAVKKGETIKLPNFSAFDYVNDIEMEKSVYVNGQKVTNENLEYTVTQEGGETLDIVYYANKGKSNEISRAYIVNVIAPAPDSDFTGYFIYDKEEFGAATGELSTIFTSLKDSDSAKIRYAYALSASNLCIDLSFDDLKSNFSYIEITLTDYIYSEISVKFRVSYKDKNMFIALQGADGEFLDKVVVTDKMSIANELCIYYDNLQSRLLNHTFAELLKINYDTLGNPFSGFESGGVLVSMEAKDIAAGDTIGIVALSNQFFSEMFYADGDYDVPSVYLFGQIANKSEINSKLVIPKALAFDALSGQYPVYLSVTFPKNSSNTNISSVEMTSETEILLDVYGSYIIKIECTDAENNRYSTSKIVTVTDNVAPKIEINGTISKEVKKGSEIKLPTVTVTDNYHSKDVLEVVVIVKTQYGNTVYNPGDNVKLETSGINKIIYVAKDPDFNMSYEEIEVLVK